MDSVWWNTRSRIWIWRRSWLDWLDRSCDVWRLEWRWLLWLLPELILDWRVRLVDWWLVWQLDLGDGCCSHCASSTVTASTWTIVQQCNELSWYHWRKNCIFRTEHCTECFSCPLDCEGHWCWEHSHVRPIPPSTGSARVVHKGPGLVGVFLATVAVLHSFGRPQGLPLMPETVSQRLDFPDLTCHTETYHDALSAYHDKCIAAVPEHEHWIPFDSGAAARCCPADGAPDYPLLPVGKDPPKLRSVTGKPLNIFARKLIKYDAAGVSLFVNYDVCDVPFCLVSVTSMLLQGYRTVLGKDCMKLMALQEETINVTRHGTLLYLTPSIVA